MITDIYKDILKKENLLNLEVFIRVYQTFEEIPLVSRYQNLRFLNERINKEDWQIFLVNLALFLLNNIELYARSRLSPEEYKHYFVCITFPDLNDINTSGYAIPNFFVTRKNNLLRYLNVSQSDSLDGIEPVKSAFHHCGLINSFSFIKTIDRDAMCGDLVRIYAIDQTNKLKLSLL